MVMKPALDGSRPHWFLGRSTGRTGSPKAAWCGDIALRPLGIFSACPLQGLKIHISKVLT
jgi:hypothetical protein